MNRDDFFAEVANGFRATIEKRPTNSNHHTGAEYSKVYIIGYFDEVIIIIIEVLPKAFPGVVFGLVRHKSQLKPFLVGDGPYEIGQNVAEQNILEPGFSLVPIRELNSDYIHWNRSDRAVRDLVPHRPDEIQNFRWPKGFIEL